LPTNPLTLAIAPTRAPPMKGDRNDSRYKLIALDLKLFQNL
jgi:hypothetical protein